MKTVLVAVLIIVGACAAMRPTQRSTDIAETVTKHKRGEPYKHWPLLEDER